MSKTWDIWSNGTKVRILSVVWDGRYTMQRVYTSVQSNKSFSEWVASYDSTDQNGLAMMSQTLMGMGLGRELWDWEVSREQAVKIRDDFQKSARKAGFISHGTVKRN